MNTLRRTSRAIIGSPFVWGILVSIGFYALLLHGPLDVPLIKRYVPVVKRYFAGHPVEYMETVLFCVGLAALVIKLFDVFGQRASLAESPLGRPFAAASPVEHSEDLLERLDRLPERRQREYYISRLRAALEHIRWRGSADALGDELKYLADVDAARAYSGHGLFRVIVWAIPILGFLGTVIGITMALNGIDLSAPDKSMFDVLNGLGVKFDTTALALSLAMVLMFVHYCVDRVENRLLDEVDRRVLAELGDRFEMSPGGADGQIVALRRLSETLLQAIEKSSHRQVESWDAALASAAGRWADMAELAANKMQSAMSVATDDLARQTQIMQQAIEASGEVARLEDTLNRNLAALAGAKHFQQTVLSLSAAVNMLSARLAELPGAAAPVKLETPRRTTNAA